MISAGKIAPFWIQTATGRAFDLSCPSPSMVCIEDIAHAEAQINRYTGHAAWPYSVAQHSIMVAEIVAATAPELALAALLHDAEEAYMGDWSTPLKCVVDCHAINLSQHIAERINSAVRGRFGLSEWGAAGARTIKHADLVALATEKRDLFGPPPQEGWGDATGFVIPAPLEKRCEDWSWTFAKARFLEAFDRYGGVR